MYYSMDNITCIIPYNMLVYVICIISYVINISHMYNIHYMCTYICNAYYI